MNQKGVIAPLILVGLLAVGIIAGISLLKSPHILRSKAYDNPIVFTGSNIGNDPTNIDQKVTNSPIVHVVLRSPQVSSGLLSDYPDYVFYYKISESPSGLSQAECLPFYDPDKQPNEQVGTKVIDYPLKDTRLEINPKFIFAQFFKIKVNSERFYICDDPKNEKQDANAPIKLISGPISVVTPFSPNPAVSSQSPIPNNILTPTPAPQNWVTSSLSNLFDSVSQFRKTLNLDNGVRDCAVFVQGQPPACTGDYVPGVGIIGRGGAIAIKQEDLDNGFFEDHIGDHQVRNGDENGGNIDTRTPEQRAFDNKIDSLMNTGHRDEAIQDLHDAGYFNDNSSGSSGGNDNSGSNNSGGSGDTSTSDRNDSGGN